MSALPAPRIARTGLALGVGAAALLVAVLVAQALVPADLVAPVRAALTGSLGRAARHIGTELPWLAVAVHTGGQVAR